MIGKLERALEARGRGVVFFDRELLEIDRIDRVALELERSSENGIRVHTYGIREDPRDGWIEERVIAKVDLGAVNARLARAVYERAFFGLRYDGAVSFEHEARREVVHLHVHDDAQRVILIGSRELEPTRLARAAHDGEEFPLADRLLWGVLETRLDPEPDEPHRRLVGRNADRKILGEGKAAMGVRRKDCEDVPPLEKRVPALEGVSWRLEAADVIKAVEQREHGPSELGPMRARAEIGRDIDDLDPVRNKILFPVEPALGRVFRVGENGEAAPRASLRGRVGREGREMIIR